MKKEETIKDIKKEILDEETINSLIKSEEDIENGRTRDAREVMNEFKKKYGF